MWSVRFLWSEWSVHCALRDVQKYGVSCHACLSESDQCDAVLCALVTDLDFEGQKELLLGTYGQVSMWASHKGKKGYEQKKNTYLN